MKFSGHTSATRPNSYFLPACLLLILFAGFYLIEHSTGRSRRLKPPGPHDERELASLPGGNVLNVVVDLDAIYVGDRRIAFGEFERFLEIDGRQMKISYAVVAGTEGALYGRAVEAFVAVRRILGVEETFDTRELPVGTRRRAVVYWRYMWDNLDSDE